LSAWKLRSVILLTAFAGGSLALTIVAANLSWTLNLHFGGPVSFGKWVLIDGALAAVLGFIMLSYERLRAERDAQAARAESAALTAQIRPHFLFNTLNAISAQIANDPAAAQENLGRLGDMFRYTMKHARQDTVPLSDEIDMTREYLLLEKARFGDRLQFALPERADTRLPGLTLQPLVENAVRHGVAKRTDGDCVTVSVEQTGENRILRVRNPVLADGAISENQLFREGHALWILRQRLPGLKTHQGPGWFEVEVPLP
jgi:LytS/YehU family sensor histidine kinase